MLILFFIVLRLQLIDPMMKGTTHTEVKRHSLIIVMLKSFHTLPPPLFQYVLNPSHFDHIVYILFWRKLSLVPDIMLVRSGVLQRNLKQLCKSSPSLLV